MVIDFRLRPPVGNYLEARMYDVERTVAFNRRLGFDAAPSVRELSLELTFREMDQAGVELGVVVGRAGSAIGSVTNDELAELVRAHPARFVAIAGLDVHNVPAAVAEVERAANSDEFRGVTLEPGWSDEPHDFDHERLYPIYERARELGLPVVFLGGGNAGPDITYSSPVPIDRVAQDFPQLTMVLAHGGFPWITEVLGTAFRRPNVYLSPDMYMFNSLATQAYVDAINTFLADRFIFASSYPFVPIEDAYERFTRLPIQRDALPLLVRENARRILGMSG